MGRKQNRFAPILQLQQCALHQHRVYRVQTAERLVHHNQIGIVQERGYQLNLLLHPLGEFPGLLINCVGYLHPIRPIQCTPARLFGRQPVQLTEEDQLIQNLHLLVESALLGQIPHPFQAPALEWLLK